MPRLKTSLLAAIVVVLASCQTAAPPRVTRVPDPTAPPLVGVALSPAELLIAQRAVAAAEKADFVGARRFLAKLPAGHPITRLAELEIRFLQGEEVAGEARAFAEANDGYGSAWGLAAAAARKQGDVEHALEAARRAAALQPGGRWEREVGELEGKLLEVKLRQASDALASGDAATAFAKAQEVLAANPGSVPARLLAVRAALAKNDPGAAAGLVPALPDTAEGLEAKGRVAAALGQWDLAMELYRRLPEGFPQRCELIIGAREKVRLANAPPYLTRALASSRLSRRGLAAIIAWEAPGLASKATGGVPVFEDIVQLPERWDILTVARLGIMPGDAIARRFGADRTVTSRELSAVLERLASVLGRPAPVWCGDARPAGCIEMPSQIDGKSAGELVERIVGEGGDPCTRR